MDNVVFQERVKRLKEVNEVIKDFDPSIREGALRLLSEYVIGHSDKGGRGDTAAENCAGQSALGDAAPFFERFPDSKPSDNPVLIAAFLYSQFGDGPFRFEEVREIAGSVGLTIPSRIDMTLKKAQREGKSLFLQSGRGEFKPTVHGELYLKKAYQVTKGIKKRQAQGSES